MHFRTLYSGAWFGYRVVVGIMILGLVSTEIEDLFTELFFGAQGAWIGFILLASIMMVVTLKVKWSGILFSVASVFIAIMMVDAATLATDSNLWWIVIMYFILPFFLILLMLKDRKGGF